MKLERVRVTGGAGFVGSPPCERLRAEACEGIAFDDRPTGRMDDVAPLPASRRLRFEHDGVTLATRLLDDWAPRVSVEQGSRNARVGLRKERGALPGGGPA